MLNDDQIRYSTDQAVWDILRGSRNAHVKQALYKINNYKKLIHVCYEESEPYDIVVHTKFRGINPLVEVGQEVYHLTDVDQEFAAEYQRVKDVIEQGWRVKFVGALAGIPQNISGIIS
jgi:hypothetical protein